MKVALLLLALCAAAYAQQGSETLAEFINREVHTLIQAESHLSVDECTSRCDADFVIDSDRLEHETDVLCREACERAVHHRPGP